MIDKFSDKTGKFS